ncbi:MAG: metallophosphoesterase [Hyphomicrobiaceae bacterium]|nr:metallophosphoesterase [Hyphomicrobiaceae bacterium]
MITRRAFIRGLIAMGASGLAIGGYAVAEPFRMRVTTHRVRLPRWPSGLDLRLAVVSDIHVLDPWMSLERVREIVTRTNALEADAVLLLGDYVPSHGMQKWARRLFGEGRIENDVWARELARLSAPLGVHAVLGNHDWWDDIGVQERRGGPVPAAQALASAGIAVYENRVVRLAKGGQPFWLAGLGDQWAFWPRAGEPWRSARIPYQGVDDLPATLMQVTDDAPVVLMAHEPDIFARMGPLADRVALTVSGHTHGGQISLLGWTPVVPSAFGARYVYGHIVEDGRHLVVTSGLGVSGVPLRLGAPPEIVVIDVGSERTA